MEYRARVADALLRARLAHAAAVVLEGPRGAGVSSTAAQLAGHTWAMASDDYARQLVDMSPRILFAERPPVLFDDWHESPSLLQRVHAHVGAGPPEAGRLLLAGWQTPREAELRETLDGQVSWLRMRPMSLSESGHSTGEVSLAALFAREEVEAPEPDLDAHDLFERMVVGGWPSLQGLTEAKARRWLRDHLLTLVRTDLPAQGVRRGPEDLRRLMATLATGVGTEQKIAEVARGVAAPGAVRPRSETVTEYLAALRRLLLLEDVPAWSPAMRSAAALRRTPRRFFTDPSIGLVALGLGSDALKRDLAVAARHFEALVLRDLRTYADVLDGTVHHVRDNNGRTVDLVVVLPDGAWGAVQVRMNPAGADAAASGLKWLASRVDPGVEGQPRPSFLAVVTGTGPAHTRPDGIRVVPVGALAP